MKKYKVIKDKSGIIGLMDYRDSWDQWLCVGDILDVSPGTIHLTLPNGVKYESKNTLSMVDCWLERGIIEEV